MTSYQPRIELRHDHAPDTDVWAWVIIGLVGAGVMLAI